jgi:hypothetical protein
MAQLRPASLAHKGRYVLVKVRLPKLAKRAETSYTFELDFRRHYYPNDRPQESRKAISSTGRREMGPCPRNWG